MQDVYRSENGGKVVVKSLLYMCIDSKMDEPDRLMNLAQSYTHVRIEPILQSSGDISPNLASRSNQAN